jgi:hypothetical protein
MTSRIFSVITQCGSVDIRRYKPDDCALHSHRCDNLKSNKYIDIYGKITYTQNWEINNLHTSFSWYRKLKRVIL